MRWAFACSLALAACSSGWLVGCASDQSAAYQVVRSLVRPNAEVDAGALRPDLRYLRVSANGKAAMMVLGYTEPADAGPPLQVWYSAVGEVLRLRDGRLAGLVGAPVEWRAVSWPAGVPAWGLVAVSAQLVSYERRRDEMPGYRLDVAERLSLTRLSGPPRGIQLEGVAAADLLWFEESAVDGRSAPARYGVRHNEVIYGEQCLSDELCLAWQAWPPVPDKRP